MALELRQQVKLSQQLVMTPQLQQAIKLLQLSRLELAETIQQEIELNPVLDEELSADTDTSPEGGGMPNPSCPSRKRITPRTSGSARGTLRLPRSTGRTMPTSMNPPPLSDPARKATCRRVSISLPRSLTSRPTCVGS